jgi:hypothetical protein
VVYVGSDDGKVYALNAANGAYIWSYTTGNEVYSSPAVVGGVVYVGSWDGKVYAFGPAQGILSVEDIEPVQTLVNSSVLIQGRPTVFNMTIVSTYPDPRSNVYLLITCGSQSWYEGPLTIPANGKIPFCTGGTYYRNGQVYSGHPYGPSGEFDLSITIDAFSVNKRTFTKHIGPQNGYRFKDMGPMKVLYIPVGFWKDVMPWSARDPDITNEKMTDEKNFGDSFTKAVFPVDPRLYKSEVASRFEMPAPNLIDSINRRMQAIAMVMGATQWLKIYQQPSMGGYNRIVAVVPNHLPSTWLNDWCSINGIGMDPGCGTFACSPVVWCEEGYWATPAHELWHSYTNIPWHCLNQGGGYWDQQHACTMSQSTVGGQVCSNQPLMVQCLMHGGDLYHGFMLGTYGAMELYQWICPQCYDALAAHAISNINDPAVLFVSGIAFDNDTVNLQPFYYFSDGYADLELGSTGNYTLRFLDVGQQVLSNIGFNMTVEQDFNVSGFGFAVPYPQGVAQIQVLHEGNIVASRDVSANAPTVNVTYPESGAVLTSGDNVTVQWQSFDADNDSLSYTVLYSPDNGSSWIPVGTGLVQTGLNWTVPNDHPASQCRIKVVASDGVNTGEGLSNGTFTILRHDVAATDLLTGKTVVGEGYTLPVDVTVQNNGNYIETLTFEVFANTTLIQTQVVTLTSGNSSTLTFFWNTTGRAFGNYTIGAYAWPVPSETNTADNNLTGGMISISIVGDITGPTGWPDGEVNMYDVGNVARRFMAKPPSPDYNPNCDINGDGVINMIDIGTVARHFGETIP